METGDVGGEPVLLDDDGLGALQALGILLGQHGGRMEISDYALVCARSGMAVKYYRHEAKRVWVLELIPA